MTVTIADALYEVPDMVTECERVLERECTALEKSLIYGSMGAGLGLAKGILEKACCVNHAYRGVKDAVDVVHALGVAADAKLPPARELEFGHLFTTGVN